MNGLKVYSGSVDEAMDVDPPTSRSKSPPIEPHISMSAMELKEFCELTNGKELKVVRILGETPPQDIPKSAADLHPEPPRVIVTTHREAHSPTVQKFLLQFPIVVVRGLPSALKMELSLFLTSTLAKAHPNHPVEVRTQKCQSPDKNQDKTGKHVWKCFSRPSSTTILKYASYQASHLKNSEETPEMIKFGTNVDLSDEEKWKRELQELQKLPNFARVTSVGNILSHIHPILGMNTVQLYMKVPGSRTPGHQENNNFAAVNINIGPGDTEWFAVANEYWTKIRKLCEENQVNYLHDSWWPDLKSLESAKIPVYRFTQKPGELVWVNVGCVHWVQAVGYCNNIAWNVGPFTSTQYQLAMERYEWNKLQSYTSIVPMINLSWNLARNLNEKRIKVSDAKLFNLIRNTLMKSLLQCFQLLEYARAHKVEVRFHGREKNEASHYCALCKAEVFNIIFVKEHRKLLVIHCADCLKKQRNLRKFVCLKEFKIEDLMGIYDNFVLHKALPPFPPKIQATSSH